MQNFADQCLDMARSILGHNLEAIQEDGSILPVEGESPLPEEPGHAAMALGEFYRATGEARFGKADLVDLTARCLTAQIFAPEESENGLACAALGLLAFGPARDRNPVWERLLDQTREQLDRRLTVRTEHANHLLAFSLARSVARFSMGFSRKDETPRLLDQLIEHMQKHSTGGFFDDAPSSGLGGMFDAVGVMALVFVRQALQLHAVAAVRERKLPSLRTHAEKYLKLLPDVVRQDGLAWCWGRGAGVHAQMHSISLILQAMRDGWIGADQMPLYMDLLRRLFLYFFSTCLDQEHGFLVIRDAERSVGEGYTTRMASFDAVRYLCQWARLAKSTGATMAPKSQPPKAGGRFVVLDRSSRKEQGIFLYQDPATGLQVQLPLVGGGGLMHSDFLAFPHCPGIFDWPVGQWLPILQPELTFGENVVVPSFYGRQCVAGMGLRNAFYFRYEQPELITREEKIISGIGSCKVNWTFSGNQITSEFIFTVKNPIQMDSMRYAMALAAPHSRYHAANSLMLGAESLRATVVKDDFQASWAEPHVVSTDPAWKTPGGKIHYIQMLVRDHPLIMRPGQQYRLAISFEPDITTVAG